MNPGAFSFTLNKQKLKKYKVYFFENGPTLKRNGSFQKDTCETHAFYKNNIIEIYNRWFITFWFESFVLVVVHNMDLCGKSIFQKKCLGLI